MAKICVVLFMALAVGIFELQSTERCGSKHVKHNLFCLTIDRRLLFSVTFEHFVNSTRKWKFFVVYLVCVCYGYWMYLLGSPFLIVLEKNDAVIAVVCIESIIDDERCSASIIVISVRIPCLKSITSQLSQSFLRVKCCRFSNGSLFSIKVKLCTTRFSRSALWFKTSYICL